MSDNFFKIKNGLNLPTVSSDPTAIAPAANPAAGDMVFYNGSLYKYNGTSWNLIVNADIAANAAIDGTKITPNFGSQTIRTTTKLEVSANTSAEAVIISQIGSGNALVVEDSANPDTTSTIIDASGNVGIGVAANASLTDKLTVVGAIGTDTIKARTSSGLTFQEDGGTTVGSVSDAGAWTLGPSGGSGANHTVYTSTTWFRTDDATAANRSGAKFSFTSGSSGRLADLWLDPNGADGSGSDYAVIRAKQDGSVEHYVQGNLAMSSTSAGAWTLGPVNDSNTLAQILYGRLITRTASTDSYMYLKSSTATDIIFKLVSNVSSTESTKWRVEADGDTISSTGSYTSDARAKKNLAPIQYGLAEILQLSPKAFNWYHESDEDVKSFCISTAQEVQAIMPEMVRDDGLDGPNGEKMKAIYDKEIMAVMVKAIQELAAKVDAQAEEIKALKAQP